MSAVLDHGELAPPLYPYRSIYHVSECGIKPLRDLETWVQGGVFHPYGVPAWKQGPTLEEALERIRDNPAVLELTGELLSYRRTVEYWIRYRQAGDTDSLSGYGGPHPSPEDASYSSLTLIEQHEREQYVERLVIGLA